MHVVRRLDQCCITSVSSVSVLYIILQLAYILCVVPLSVTISCSINGSMAISVVVLAAFKYVRSCV